MLKKVKDIKCKIFIYKFLIRVLERPKRRYSNAIRNKKLT